MALTVIQGDVHITGTATAGALNVSDGTVTNAKIADTAGIVRTKLAQESLVKFAVPLDRFRVWDALGTNLPNTSANDDLAYDGGTFGTDSPLITTQDIAGETSILRYARVLVAMPAEYDSAQDVQIRISAGTISGTADVSATVDVEAYESNKTGGLSADLCTTAAQSINSATFDNKDFVITPSSLVAGDLLDIRIAIAVDDTSGTGTLEAAIGSVELLCDIRG